MANITENPLYLMMILITMGILYMVGVAFFALVVVWAKGYCHRSNEFLDQEWH